MTVMRLIQLLRQNKQQDIVQVCCSRCAQATQHIETVTHVNETNSVVIFTKK